jgi:hypothetical protein
VVLLISSFVSESVMAGFAFVEFCHCVSYLITLSARASTFGGMVRPICFAVFKLMISSNVVGCSTGRSAGFAP